MAIVLVWLAQSECQEVAKVGAKAAHLSKLLATHRVPDGFCLTTDAYRRWGEAALAQGGNLPAEVVALLYMAYARLTAKNGGSPPPVAVRSSAVGEDSQDASFAGQYETYLNVLGEDQLIQSVLRCWASADGSRVQHYRRKQPPDLNRPHLAVLVQEMILADSALVAFSRNPVSGNAQEVVVNATWGLGESLVGGVVTPDSYLVDSTSLSIQDRQVAAKLRMTVPAPTGVREIAVPRLLRTRASLTDNQVIAAARLALALEEQMGWPVDIECAYRGETLYLLQCRPITTL